MTQTSEAAQQSRDVPYYRIGEAEGTRRITDAFYDIVEHDPAYARLRALHPADLTDTRQALFEFLSGWLGGPPLYHDNPKRGCIMSAHAGVAIDADLREMWVRAMRQALVDAGLTAEMRAFLDAPFARIAEAMRNR